MYTCASCALKLSVITPLLICTDRGDQEISITGGGFLEVDGAGPIVKFRRVILPMLMPAIVFAAVFRAVDAFRSFDLIYGLSYGGPARGTTTLAFFSFQNGFQFQNSGYAAAVAYSMLIIVIIGTTVLLRYVQLRPGQPR